jgi:hypothetical protein
MTEAYPLQWPDGWPRTRSDHREDSRYRFKTGTRRAGDSYEPGRAVTFDVARKKLCEELDRLGASGVVISTNLPLRADGFPRADAARNRVQDPGVAVYFTLKKKQMVMACDRYDAPSANLLSASPSRLCVNWTGTAEAPCWNAHSLVLSQLRRRAGKNLGARSSASSLIGSAISTRFTAKRRSIVIQTVAVATH